MMHNRVHDWLLLGIENPDEEELQLQFWWQQENEDENWILTQEEQHDGHDSVRWK